MLLPILYGVWHTNGRSRGGRILRESRAIVLQQCGQCRWAGEIKGGLIRVQTARSKTISCKGQGRGGDPGGRGQGVYMLNTPSEEEHTVFYSCLTCFVNADGMPLSHGGGGGPSGTRGAAGRRLRRPLGLRRRLRPQHLDIFHGAPLRLPKPRSDQFPVRVCSCPLCIINRL